jgi:Pathogenicity locus
VTRARRHPEDELRRIPGVGPALAGDLRLLGIEKVADLSGRDPEQLYRDLEQRAGHHVDRCVLYVFRCPVYFAEQRQPDPELTRWWSWKDGGLAERLGLL